MKDDQRKGEGLRSDEELLFSTFLSFVIVIGIVIVIVIVIVIL